ncbi:aspartate kinase [Photobacterium leiognathi]|uniref:aspartate kinase n=1 Tax=Photobacterium leiognathi TaxID=553611 RepID=UPI000D15FC72|nr:aspartate kinase [Photobacterium leiognathi]PSW44154.1 aspartate kinase [Photobacterium leiognathi subsp. mandapamensis]
MALLVQKFGGTSVGSIERIEAVAERVIKARQSGHQVVVVLSAMAGETNRLLGLAKQIDEVPTPRELDVLLAAGEQVSIALLAMALNKRGYSAVSLTADQVVIRTDNAFNNATIREVETQRMTALLGNDNIVIVAGFQGRDVEGNITTLGRGGSDTTAVAIASALDADECQIFTDVDGVYSTDPRIVPTATRLDVIHFDHMTSMARLGAKVLQLQSVEYACQHRVPLRVLSSFDEGEGTLVNFDSMVSSTIIGVALQKQHVLLEVALPKAELSKQITLFGLTPWILDHASDENKSQIVAANDDIARLKLVFDSKMRHIGMVSILSLVGDGTQHCLDAVQKVLKEASIKVHTYQGDAKCLSLLIDDEDHVAAVDLIHKKFVVDVQSLDNQSYLAVS